MYPAGPSPLIVDRPSLKRDCTVQIEAESTPECQVDVPSPGGKQEDEYRVVPLLSFSAKVIKSAVFLTENFIYLTEIPVADDARSMKTDSSTQ